MNIETIHLNMTPREADSIAWLLMTSLGSVGMLDREREHATTAANDLFAQLGYDVQTDTHGKRIEVGA